MSKRNQIILVLISFIHVIASQSSSPIISRNERVEQIRDGIAGYQGLFEYMQQNQCIEEPLSDCSDVEVWKNLRSKHSKNITNLQDKLASYNRTIQDILIANKQFLEQQVQAKNESMMKLFPDLKKLKNDEEMIEILLMVVDDTYVKSDINGLYQTIFATLSSLQSNETNETINEGQTEQKDDVPLIDEEIFNKEGQHQAQDADSLFEPGTKKQEEDQLVADEIPEGRDVKEHDSDHFQQLNQPVVDDYNQKKIIIENLNIMQLRQELRADVKEQGRYVLHMLTFFKENLVQEQERIRNDISNYEKEIFSIHNKHLHQIVQIFNESRKIQKEIFEKDDAVLQLDMKIKFCEGVAKDQRNFDECQTISKKKSGEIENVIELIQGTIKELDKLAQYKDKNVYDPNFIQQESSGIEQVEQTQKSNALEYTDYGSDDQGKLVSRKVECVVTECREKRVTSEQNFQLLLKKKYEQMSEEDLLKEGDINGTQLLENGINELENWQEKFNLIDENFGSVEKENQMINSSITDEEIESSLENLKQLHDEIQDDSNAPIEQIKNKLFDDVLEEHQENEMTAANNLIMHSNQKNNKKKVTKKESINKKKENVDEKIMVENKQYKEGLFSRMYHYFFGNAKNQNAQNFLLQIQ